MENNKEKEIDYTENTLFQNFPRETFSSKTALWVRAFCYSFVAIHLFSIILERIQHYCITPPGMFLQIIFFIIMAVIVEFVCIQTTNITDHLTLDYAKDIVSSTRHRFFLLKISILASFDQIRMVGVSCGPTNRIKHLFSNPANRYAVVFMNYRNQIVQINNFSMSLEEANRFGLELAEKHMSSAKFIQGEEDMQLVADPISGQIQKRKAMYSFMSTIDAAILPVLQAFLALLLTIGLVTFSMAAINHLSINVIDSDLLVSYQPITQLFARPEPRPDFVAPPIMPATKSEPNIQTAPETMNEMTTLPPTATTLPAADVAAIADQPAENMSATETTIEIQAEPPPTVSEAADDTVVADASTTENAVTSPPLPVEEVLPAAAKETELIETPVIVQVPPQPERANDLLEIEAATKPKISPPVEPPAPEVRLNPEKPAIKTRPKANKPTSDSRKNTKAAILPGLGLHNLIDLGDDLTSHKLGQPVATKTAGNGHQVVFSGLTLLADAKTGRVKQISITRDRVLSGIKCQTPQNFAVGGKLNQIRERMGPPTLIDKLPGLHFPALGISFIAAALSPDTIGAILIYTPGTLPD